MGKKNILTWVTAVLLVFTAVHGFAQEEKNGPKIVLEEDAKTPKLRFLDATGKETNMILLAIPPAIEIKEVRKKHGRLKKEALIKEINEKRAIVSKDGKHALLIEMSYETFVPETAEEKKAIGDTDADYLSTTSQITLYDVNGNAIWKKQASKNLNIVDAAISDDGQLSAFIQAYMMGGTDEGEPYEKLVVVDATGKELFKFPNERGKYRLRDKVSMSPQGRYIGVNGHIEYGEEITLFFDLKNKTMREEKRIFVISSIGDNGIAKISYPNPNIKDSDSYEKKIKEGILTETINLKLFLGE